MSEISRPGRLPSFDSSKNACFDPHVIILGAGASLAALPDGDAAGTQLPVMPNFVEVVGIAATLDSATVEWRDRDFEEVFSELVAAEGREALVRELEARIYEYFASLQLPDKVTLYDEILVSLRDKDLVATFNWDPLLLQAYRRNAAVRRLPQIAFLHGNVAVGVCIEHRVKARKGDPCQKCGRPLAAVPLLYPVTVKNYHRDPFIEAEWHLLSAFLERAYLMTILGYSAPAADVEAKDVMVRVWESNRTRELAQISIIDVKPRAKLQEAWEPFFVRDHYGISRTLDQSQLFAYPRRSCDAFVMASLQLEPCRARPLVRTPSLSELHAFVAPLVAEEDALDERGEPFQC